MYTYQDLIRKYSADVEQGTADTDLTPRQRRLCMVMLNLASNGWNTTVQYPPRDEVREAAVKQVSDILWDARPLLFATVAQGGKAEDNLAEDITVASGRAIEILRNI